ncbi:hypothetical protein BUALT_Bualt15G0033300 [Buddleja alternifolia]|uniref:HTH myb-type domain-containing protein n=1 Tax=Buddleja alternifolia TaxID=168488 RepID=A0AAV6WMT4_9LAMI|nr:hypothetical protein BUALT_Bualt15G0033300 [Buddleja alternifolia]
MAPLNPSELSLDCRFSLIPNPIGAFTDDILKIPDVSEKISKLNDCVYKLQDEMKKIEAFKRELPLCMILLNDGAILVIVTLNNELSKCNKLNAEPVLEEFIPLKNSITEEKDEKIEDNKEKDIINNRDKMNWMSSVQLWNSDDHNNSPNTDISSDKATSKLDSNKKRKEEETNRPPMDNLFPNVKIKTVGRAFVPFKGCTNLPVMTVGKEDKDELPARLSLCMPEIKNSREEINPCGFSSKSSFSKLVTSSAINGQSNLKSGQPQSSRKQRRCWSPELHRRFVSALEQLGGPQVATPKQIRELMQVDGLTNDEVKSHLQKYRLHTRKSHPTTNTSVTLGGLWMSQEQCGETSKHSNSQSGSPPGPFQLGESSRVFEDDSMEDEDEYDEKSESHSWKR